MIHVFYRMAIVRRAPRLTDIIKLLRTDCLHRHVSRLKAGQPRVIQKSRPRKFMRSQVHRPARNTLRPQTAGRVERLRKELAA